MATDHVMHLMIFTVMIIELYKSLFERLILQEPSQEVYT